MDATWSWMKSLPTNSWWRNPSAIARYAYRWMPYQVSREIRRRAARAELIATAAKSTALAVAMST